MKKQFKDLISNEPSKIHEIMAFRKANKAWLSKSMRIAVTVLSALRDKKISQNELAEKMGVSPQYVSKILKGQENLTLQNISKIEEILGITLMALQPYKAPVPKTDLMFLQTSFKFELNVHLDSNEFQKFIEQKFASAPGSYSYAMSA